jgi:hypothetical protein
MPATTSQTISNQNGDPTAFAMAAGVKNIPAAITSPATTAVAEANPSRLSSPALERLALTGFSTMAAIEIRSNRKAATAPAAPSIV